MEDINSLDGSIQKIKIVSAKGTTSYFVHNLPELGLFHKSSTPKSTKLLSREKLVCHTCKKEITSDLSRFLIMYNHDNAPRFFSFHFFFPCWNSEEFFTKYSNWTLARAGFSLSEEIPLSKKNVKNLQNNESFWE